MMSKSNSTLDKSATYLHFNFSFAISSIPIFWWIERLREVRKKDPRFILKLKNRIFIELRFLCRFARLAVSFVSSIQMVFGMTNEALVRGKTF